jgi:hypothetical protein
LKVELGTCGFTQKRIIKIADKWHTAEEFIGLNATTKQVLHRLADIHANEINAVSKALIEG